MVVTLVGLLHEVGIVLDFGLEGVARVPAVSFLIFDSILKFSFFFFFRIPEEDYEEEEEEVHRTERFYFKPIF